MDESSGVRSGDEGPGLPESAKAALTTGAVARHLGVSPTTLRSWDRRYGLGPAVRPDGRHRRWTPRDVAMLETMCRLTSAGVPPAEAARTVLQPVDGAPVSGASQRTGNVPRTPAPEREPVSGDTRQECRGLSRAAVRLDAAAVDERLTCAVDRHGLAVAWQEVMVPALHTVGRRWASSGDRYVEVEHLLSWHVSHHAQALYARTRGARRRRTGRPRLCAGGGAHAAAGGTQRRAGRTGRTRTDVRRGSAGGGPDRGGAATGARGRGAVGPGTLHGEPAAGRHVAAAEWE